MVIADPYWLCRCEGWQVVSPEGRVGRVVRILFASSANVPEALAVRTGLFRTRELILPASAVAVADPHARKVILHPEAASSEFPAILEAGRASAEDEAAGSLGPHGGVAPA
jgi:hypothetical protein